MDTYRYGHCTVVIESNIFTMGGFFGSSSLSSSVQSIDTDNKTDRWRDLESMKTGRKGHGCHVWTYDGQPGIVVVGGLGDSGYLRSVEFYSNRENSWVQLGSLITPRYGHSVTTITGMLIASGG